VIISVCASARPTARRCGEPVRPRDQLPGLPACGGA
jgi:hypothetical protein